MLHETLQENYTSYNEILNPIYVSCNFTKYCCTAECLYITPYTTSMELTSF